MRGLSSAALAKRPIRAWSRPRPGRWSPALPLIGLMFWGCAHASHTVTPYRDDPVAASALAGRARAFCLEHSSEPPPRSFVTDGCTAFANDGWTGCCVEHDIAYWCGGTAAARKEADQRLERCVADLGHPLLARLMYLGVRLGGPAWVPAHWRWGFGWGFPYGCRHDGGPASANDGGVSPDPGPVR